MWDAFVAWFQSPAGERVIDGAVIPAVAILVAGIIAALIARGAVRSLIARSDREAIAAAVAGLVEAARAATRVEEPRERERIERLRAESDIRLRLSGLPGAPLVGDWVALRVDGPARGAAPVDPSEVRDRLLGWLQRPRRARRLFGDEVERMRAEQAASAAAAAERQTTSSAPESEPGPRRQPAAAAGRAPSEAAQEAAPEQSEDAPPTTEPVLIQRTRLTTMDRPAAEAPDPRADHARHARAETVRPETESAATEAPAPTPVAAAPARAAEPAPSESEPAPEPEPGAPQPTPAWLDTYDDEAEVTRDIDLSKTPPPMSATAVRDRTRTGDDIVPRH